MRDYGKVPSSLWSDAAFLNLSDGARFLLLYLMTNTHGTLAGVFRMPCGYVAEDTRIDSGTVPELFAELFKNGFAHRCETTKWVWMLRHFEFTALENPNQRKSALKIASGIPANCSWRSEFFTKAAVFLGLNAATPDKTEPEKREPSPNPSETVTPTVSESVAVAVTVAVEKQKHVTPEGSPAADAADLSHDFFSEFWKLWPASPRKIGKAKCASIWKRDKLNKLANRIFQHVTALKTSEQWRSGFDPSPQTYLGQKRYLDDMPAPSASEPYRVPAEPSPPPQLDPSWAESASGLTSMQGLLGLDVDNKKIPFSKWRSIVLKAFYALPTDQRPPLESCQ